jgi:hypothetical protein
MRRLAPHIAVACIGLVLTAVLVLFLSPARNKVEKKRELLAELEHEVQLAKILEKNRDSLVEEAQAVMEKIGQLHAELDEMGVWEILETDRDHRCLR